MLPPPDDLGRARHARMRWNTPLSGEHADLLLERLLDVRAGAQLLDLGCGWGELLLRAVALGGAGGGTGVDTDAWTLDRGRARAAELGLGDRVNFVLHEAAAWRESADRVLCIGASHAWGGARQALLALRAIVRPGGRLLFGDACWERPPTDEAAAIFGKDTLALEVLVDHAVINGWRVLHLSTSDQREWDDFESTWRAGRQQWVLRNADDHRVAEVQDTLDTQLQEYLTAYRGVLGFCYLVLGR